MFVNNESTAGVGNDKPVSILSDHFILSCFLDVAVITPCITWLYKLKFPFSMSRHADELHNLQSGMRFHCDKVACTFYLYFLIM